MNGEEEEDLSYLDLPIDEQMEYLLKEETAERKTKPRPWINLLTYPGKARWRVTSKYPDQLVQERSAMLHETHRTGRQLKRAFRNILEQQQKLAKMRERGRILETTGKQGRPQKKKGATEAVQEAISYGPEQTFVSINHRLLPNFAVTRRVLKEVTALLGGAANFKPKRVIDFGCGCGSASAAAMSVFQNMDDNSSCALNWIHGIEPSRSQREAAERVLTAMKKTDEEIAKDVASSGGYLEGSGDSPPSYGEGSKMSISSRLPRVTMGESIAAETSSNATEGNFDLALFCYTAQELPHVSSSLAAAAILWEKLAVGGVLVMIEPGTPDGFNSVRAVREMLLDCCPPNSNAGEDKLDIECHVIAPCTHNGRCPMDPMSRHRETLIVDDDQKLGDVEKNVDAETEARKRLNLDDEDFLLAESATDEWLEIDDDDSDESGDGASDDNPYASWGEGEKAWFAREFETLIGEGKIFEDHSWQPKALGSTTVDAKSRRKGAHTEDVHIFDDAFCGFTHMLPVGDRKGEKFSYVVMQKKRGGIDAENDSTKGLSPLSQTNIVHLLSESIRSNGKGDFIQQAAKYESDFFSSEGDPLGLEFVQGSNRNSWGRLMRAPIKRKGHIIVDFCSSGEKDGKIVRHRVGKAKSERIAPGMYTAARKARWGGLWPDLSKPNDNNS